ncbi:MAG: phosphatidate cytidylyltransferase [Verrucomicrobia bacterium]|nr:phosphatidate cytidylyltransferase [Verrucomicrobiota bacterium]MCH8526584.1 phosphatidate cytidylyltransferase [Kiritimatiellia bacterium]
MSFITEPSHPVVQVSAAIFLLLVLAGLTAKILRRRHPERDFRELEYRIRSWWLICAVFLGAILAGGSAGLILFTFISYLAFKEYISLIPTRRVDRRVLFWAYLAIPIQYTWIQLEWYGMFVIFIPVYMFLIIPIRLVSLQETRGFLNAAGTIQWGLMITVFCLSHAAWLFVLPPALNPAAGPAGLVLFLVGLTEFNDIAQYLWGKSLGGPRILPGVSPGKTWAGFLGGVLSTAFAALLLAPFLTPLRGFTAFFIGAGIGFFGFLGDVTVSALKRDLNIKDSGGLLPGHGGILDRVDSLLFTAPLFLHFIRYYHPG